MRHNNVVLPLKNNTVGVLCGGRSNERAGSLRSSQPVIEALMRLGYLTKALDPVADNLLQELKTVDCVFVCLHGTYGEDGKVQGLLETLNIPYTGSGVLASAIGMHKTTFKKLIISEGIPTPRFVASLEGLDAELAVERIIHQLSMPVVVKPVHEGGSLGVTYVSDENDLVTCIREMWEAYGEIFVEQFISGRFLTVGLLGRHGAPEVLPVLHVDHHGVLYDEPTKHTVGAAQYIVPASLPPETYAKAQEYSKRVYLALGCHGPARVDLICDVADDLHVIEINTIPGLSQIGNLPSIAKAAGIPYDVLIEDILHSAYTKPSYLP